MSVHVNGWPVINLFLKKRNKKQQDLARLLAISPSAVSQIKNGEYLLNPYQMKHLCDFLALDLQAADTFYTGIFNARIMTRARTIPPQKLSEPRIKYPEERTAGDTVAVPMLKISQMHTFQPLFMPLLTFMEQNDCDYLHLPPGKVKPETGALKIDIFSPEHVELPDQALIFVPLIQYPRSGDLCIYKTAAGEIHIKEIVIDRHLVFFKSAQNRRSNDAVWDQEQTPGYLQWIFPVTEVVIRT